MGKNNCGKCIHWGINCGFSDMYEDDLKFCNKWFKVDNAPIMKINYGSGKGCIFTPIDFCCKFFKDKEECPVSECGNCDKVYNTCEEGCF